MGKCITRLPSTVRSLMTGRTGERGGSAKQSALQFYGSAAAQGIELGPCPLSPGERIELLEPLTGAPTGITGVFVGEKKGILGNLVLVVELEEEAANGSDQNS